MTLVTIPTASYVRNDFRKNVLLPELLPAIADFNQQAKLWRFYCTCYDVGCSGYKLEDFIGKNMTQKDKYIYWVKNWKTHYEDVSNLIRLYKRAKSEKWLLGEEQLAYRNKLKNWIYTKHTSVKVVEDQNLFSWHIAIINDRLDSLRRSAQHLLNARYTNKLATQAIVERQRKAEQAHNANIVTAYYARQRRGEDLALTPVE